MIKIPYIKCFSKISLTLSIFLISLPCHSQSYLETGSQSVINYTPKEYNAHNQNWAIIQDERGVMYFGKNDGLLEFDGVTWRLYAVSNNSTIRSLAYGSDGKIYAGAQGELGYFMPDSSGKLIFHSLMDFLPKDKRDFSDVWQTYVSNGKVYFRTTNYIMTWNTQKREFNIIKSENGFHFMAYVNGTIFEREWGKGLEVLKNDSLFLVPGGEKFANERIYVMLPFPGDERTILIVTRTMGLFKYDRVNFIPFKTEADQFIKENLIYLPGTILSDGNILLGTLSGGAIVIDTAGREVRRYNLENGIINNKISFTFQDRSGGIWLGTNNGISRIDYSSPVCYYDSRNNFSTSVNEIIRHNGIIYTATTNGVYALDPNTSMFHLLNYSRNQSFSFAEMRNDLLVGTFDGLFKVEKDRLTPIRKTIGNEYNVTVLKHSRLNLDRIYVATASGLWSVLKSGIDWIDEGQIFENADQPTSFVEDKDGRLWMSTFSSGLFRITFQKDDNNNLILDKPVIDHFDKTNGLQEGYLRVFKINGINYFTTIDSLYKFDESRKMFYADTSDKIISEFYKITSNISWNNYQQDNLGQMWIGAGSRLSRGTLQPDGSWKWVSAPFSRFANENIYEVYVDKNDVTWFGTDDGIIKYDFGKKNLGSKDYAALVRSVEIGEDSTIYFGGKVESFLSPEITFKNNSVKFRYSATSYEGKNVNKFKTFLDGFDDGWSRYSPETIKEYTNLPPGKYTFKVAALNLSGIESSTGTYSFEILPPWYRTLWAYAFYVLFLAAGIFVVDRVQRKRLLGKERERAEIERKNREFEEARKLQLSMLPEEIPKIPGLDIAVYMKTATEVGGDYYDLIKTDDTLTAIIGDATGHGLNAGMLVSVTKGMFQNLAFQNELEKMISQFNTSLISMRLQPMYMSLALTRIMNNRLQVVGAGMPPFLYYQSKSGIVTEIESSGPPLGGFPGFNYKVSDYELSAGDFIVMMSDGFPERRNANKEIYGWDKGKELLTNITHLGSEQIIEELVKAGDEWGGDRQQDDDITFVVFKIV